MEIINRSFTPAEFEKYLKEEVAPKMGAWRPQGAVIHNTDAPLLKNWPGIVNGKPITVQQRLKNIEHGYNMKGWSSGPHLFIDTEKIHVFTPLWKKGTHSPSFNGTHWGIELVGNFDVETFPLSMFEVAVAAISDMYDMLGKTPTADNLKYHKEDPRTTHKGCPGKNVGLKGVWLAALDRHRNGPVVSAPVEPAPAKIPEIVVTPTQNKKNVINAEALNLVKKQEAFMANAYSDRGFPAIGYGRRSGFRGFVITPGMVIDEPTASKYLSDDLDYLGQLAIGLIGRPLNDNQYGAIASFCYNVGWGNFKSSTMLSLLKAGKFAEASGEFQKWCKSTNPKTGKKERLEGLYKRRLLEAALFMKPVV